MLSRRSTAIRALPGAAASRASGCCGTACCSTSGRRSSSSPTELRARWSPRYARVDRRASGIEMVMRARPHARARRRASASACCASSRPPGAGVVVEVDDPPDARRCSRSTRARGACAARRRGTVHPAELVKLLAPARGRLRRRPAGRRVRRARPRRRRRARARSTARPATQRRRHRRRPRSATSPSATPRACCAWSLLGDPTQALGSLAEPECRRIIAALDLAEELRRAASSGSRSRPGAKIAMDTGTENMDWIAAVLRRIIEFTQAGGEINVVVTGINVGAQPYWNAEATMLMHTRGILVMTPDERDGADRQAGARLLGRRLGRGQLRHRRLRPHHGARTARRSTGRPTSPGACRVLLRYYEHTYVAPGERFPRRAETTDPRRPRRARRAAPRRRLARCTRVGDIFSDATQPGAQAAVRHPLGHARGRRRRPRAARALGGHARRRGRGGLGRAPGRLAGVPDRHRVAPARPRSASLPADGPEQWTVGHAVPALVEEGRARDQRRERPPAASSCWPTSPASTARPSRCASWQLEFGAEIGRAVVNFRRPDRLLRHLPLPRRRVRRLLPAAERGPRGDRASRARAPR